MYLKISFFKPHFLWDICIYHLIRQLLRCSRWLMFKILVNSLGKHLLISDELAMVRASMVRYRWAYLMSSSVFQFHFAKVFGALPYVWLMCTCVISIALIHHHWFIVIFTTACSVETVVGSISSLFEKFWIPKFVGVMILFYNRLGAYRNIFWPGSCGVGSFLCHDVFRGIFAFDRSDRRGDEN